MVSRYVHTNIVARDWKALADFYVEVFGCSIRLPERHLSEPWLARGTGVPHARADGVHLLLPGCGEDGPTLEIFTYGENLPGAENPAANREGYGHLAFHVDDVATTLSLLLEHGGSSPGEIVETDFPSGRLTFVYAADPEGNIVELQNWLSPDIRQLTAPGELDSCLSLIRQSFLTVAEEFGITPENGPTNPAFLGRDRFLEHLDKDVVLFGLFENYTLAGCIAVEAAPAEEDVFYLERLAVLPDYRHRGYGRLLLDRAFSYARSRGGRAVSIAIIDEHIVLRKWYEDFGFTISGRKDFPHLPFNVCFMRMTV